MTFETTMLSDHVLVDKLNRIQRISLIAGAVGLALLVIGLFVDPQGSLQSYMFGYLFWAAITIGSVPLCMLHYLFGGAWGAVILRFVETGMRTLPLIILLFLPILIGMGAIFIWANPDALAANKELEHVVHAKALYLNVPFFAVRAAVFFAFWTAVAYFLTRWSARLDETGDPRYTLSLKRLSGGAMPFMVLTISFAVFDWVMSLSPAWYSGIFGVLYGTAMTLQAFVFVVLVVVVLSQRAPMSEITSPKIFGDFGNLMLAMVMFWAYLNVSQIIIIWSANLPEEAIWYLERVRGGWRWVATAIGLLHFGLPFLLLLSMDIRRSSRALFGLAILLLVMRCVDLYWLTIPSFHRPGFPVSWQDPVALVAVGGFWISFYIWQLKRRPVVAVNNPNLREVHAHA